MASPKKKFYVVWEGMATGVYATWPECESAIKGFSNAKYKAFPTRDAAERAFADGPGAYWGTGKFVSALTPEEQEAIGGPVENSLCVDAAWNADTKAMEYRGVWLHDRSLVFEQGPFPRATNNIGEFLAIVHALAWLSKLSNTCPIYSDSLTAMAWVRKRKVASKSMAKGQTSEEINNLVQRALAWLNSHEYRNEVLKWNTEAWGEVPADYGRK